MMPTFLAILRPDPLGLIFAGLGLFTAIFGASRRNLTARLALLAVVVPGLCADNIGLLWLAAGAASAMLNRRDWRLAGAALLVAGFGSVAVYQAAAPFAASPMVALSFAALGPLAPQLAAAKLALGFVLVVAGYGALAMLAARGGKLGSMPMNLALVAILRFRHIAQGSFIAGGMAAPGFLLLAFGLLALFAAGLGRGAARQAATAHAGLALFAFGVGGPAALFGGLLNMMLFTLADAAWAAARGRPAWLAAACLVALAGLPPSGLFSSEFIIVSQTMLRVPWLAPLLAAALLLFGTRLLRQAARLSGTGEAFDMAWLPALPLVLMLLLGLAMPPAFAHGLSAIAVALQ